MFLKSINVRRLFLAITLLTIMETQLMSSTTLEVKNPPRYQNSIVLTIQGLFFRT